LGAESGELVGRDADHGLEELLLADRALVGAGVDEPGEVLAEGANAGKVPLRDHAAQLAEAARVLSGELARRDARGGVLDRVGGGGKRPPPKGRRGGLG